MRREEIGPATLYCGDGRELLDTIRAGAVVSDPPYGIGYVHSGGAGANSIGKGKDYLTKFGGVAIVGDDEPFDPRPLLTLNVPTILWGANHYAERLPSSADWLVWDKRERETTLKFSDCEMAWTNLDGMNARIFRHYWNGMLKASERGIPRVHPTQKPIAVMQWCLDRLPAKCGVVFDPYMGSGTTGVACITRGRRFVGVEIDEGYFDVACRRIEQAVSQPDLYLAPAATAGRSSAPALPKAEARGAGQMSLAFAA